METRTVHLDSLLTDGLFDIPSYQRSYLLYLPEEKSHFFGNIILRKQDTQFETDRRRRFDKYDVVDGQQRLTSAIIFLYVASKFDDTVAATLDEDNLLFPVEERPRLLPQDQDTEYFRDGLLGSSSIDPETPSQTRLKAATDFFTEVFEALEDQDAVLDLAETLRYDCRINVVEIDDGSEAASIFESLNDRGRPLSTLDKTKSFLMYMDDRSSNDGALETKIKQRFGSIYRDLFVFNTGHDRVNDFGEDSFLRFHWGMYDGYNSNEYFNGFGTLKDRLREQYRAGELDAVQSGIDSYVQDLREAATAFAAILQPDVPDSVEPALTRLLELGRLANVLPVLMASYLKFAGDDPDGFADIVDACETLVFRMYAIDSRRSDTGRGRLVRLAHDVHTTQSIDPETVVERLDSITERYTDDDRFERRLRDPDFYQNTSSRDTKYLLYRYGQQVESEAGEEVLTSPGHILSTEFQVEHILARKLPTDAIPESLVDEFDEHVHRLGNLTLASRYWNSSYGNLPFSEKKHASGGREKEYASSSLRVQRELAAFDTFGQSAIDERTDTLVEFALDHWSIDPASSEPDSTDAPDEFVGWFPPDFFDRLTSKQEAMFRVLYAAEEPLLTDDLIERMEDEYGETVGGSSGLSGILAGLTSKHSKEFRHSIMSPSWAGDQFEWVLTLDSAQREQFEAEMDLK